MILENITEVLRGDIAEDSHTVSIWVECRNKKGEITLIGLYQRPPNSQPEIEEQKCKEIIKSSKKNSVVIVGDFNFPNIDWDSHSIRGLDGEKFVECIQEEFLIQYVDGLTREGAKPDLLMGNKEGQMTEV